MPKPFILELSLTEVAVIPTCLAAWPPLKGAKYGGSVTRLEFRLGSALRPRRILIKHQNAKTRSKTYAWSMSFSNNRITLICDMLLACLLKLRQFSRRDSGPC
jgi:hypothetical protein